MVARDRRVTRNEPQNVHVLWLLCSACRYNIRGSHTQETSLKALLVEAFCLWSAIAEAQQDFSSGKYYLEACKSFIASASTVSTPELFAEGACFGAVQTLTILRDVLREALPVRYRFCMPEGATTGHAIQLIVSYMESKPDRLHEQLKRWPKLGPVRSRVSGD